MGAKLETLARDNTSPEVSRISSGVDWWRVASKSSPNDLILLRLSGMLAEGLQSQGHEGRSWRFEGYDGTKISSMFVGTRQGDVLLNVSGSMAHQACLATKLHAERATRIDLRIDWQFHSDEENYAKRQVEAVEAFQRLNNRRSNPGLLLYDGRGKGDTLRIGAPDSASFSRLYDKGREQKAWDRLGWWRYEVQFNKDYGPVVLQLLKQSENEAQTAYNIVLAYAAERGLQLPLPPGQKVTLPTPKAPPTSAEKKLNWLRNQVRGSVQELIKQGYEDEVFKALFENDNHSIDGPEGD